MARLQTLQDKEQFFADLDRLCESDEYSDNELVEPTLRPCSSFRSAIPQATVKSDVVHNNDANSARDKSSAINTDSQPPDQYAGPVSRTARSYPPAASNVNKSLISRKGAVGTGTDTKRNYQSLSEISRGGRVKKVKENFNPMPEEQQIFKSLTFFFVPNDDIAKPRKTRILKAREYGAHWVTSYSDMVTHVIVEPHIHYLEAAKAFPNRQIPQNAVLVKSTWLTESLSRVFLRDTSQSRFQVAGAPKPVVTKHSSGSALSTRQLPKIVSGESSRLHEVSSTDVPSDTESVLGRIVAEVTETDVRLTEWDLEDTHSLSSTVSETSFGSVPASEHEPVLDISQKESRGFKCMEPDRSCDRKNPNSTTIAVLEEMVTYYDCIGDHWRTTAYRKAIYALRKQTTLIATRDQALSIPQIGSRLADKIEEIVTTKQLRRLEHVRDDPHTHILQLFMGIYGVGYKQASQWLKQGYRTLSDLLERANLTSNQRIGIERYDDFQQRIPRAEVTQHAGAVQHACYAADKDLRVIIGGSYRRGNTTSGDIDLLITKPDANMSAIGGLVTSVIIPALTATGFLKCTLASSTHGQTSTDIGSKWHGASCLATSSTWRRIDLLFVPGDEIGAALLYFTGDDIFNRSMRLLASRKGMCLNQHGLYQDVIRGRDRVKLTKGSLLEGKSERRIFEILGVPWREPWERKCC